MSEAACKSGWTLVAFGEMAEHIAERVEPTPDDCENYVGLEHLDSGSLTVRRWGAEVALIGTKLRMRKGDILFAKRNAYLRRVALAPHDGLFSAHGMVLRAFPRVVLPEFLPFFMQSDIFMDRAEQISVGSLSPTINWGTLKEQQFALPPLEEQRRIADALLASERCFQQYSQLETAERCLESSLFSRVDILTRNPLLLDQIITESSYGCSTRANSEEKGLPILRIPNVLRGELDMSDLKWVALSDQEIARYELHDGDILVVRTNGNPEYVGRCLVVPALEERTVYASYLIRLVADASRVRPQYLTTMLNSPLVRRALRRHIRSSAGNYNINTEGLRATQIPVPTLERQDEMLGQLAKINQAILQCESRKSAVRELRRCILQECVQ
jgi:restriction endonuclease S subunit